MQSTDPPKSRREEYIEATRQALLVAAEGAFAELGYAAAGTEAISKAARVSRGAFYHHFEDKRAIFDAVVVALQVRAAAAIKQKARSETDLWQSLHAGIEAFLDVCSDPRYARIVIQDAPVVLGSDRYRQIEDTHVMPLLIGNLEALGRRKELPVEHVALLAHMIDAMISKVAVLLMASPSPDSLKRDGLTMIRHLLEGFRDRSARA